MENIKEQNSEMTAQESLSLITEALNKSRKEITRRSGKYYILWGILLTVFSLLLYVLWKTTDKGEWNFLWFALPVVGLVAQRLLGKKDETVNVHNDVSRITGGIWAAFAIFACAVAVFTVLYSHFSENIIGVLSAGLGMTVEIMLLFGLAECISGVALKNWAVKIAGVVTGIGGLVIYYITGACEEQIFMMTFAGLVLVATGLIVKSQYK